MIYPLRSERSPRTRAARFARVIVALGVLIAILGAAAVGVAFTLRERGRRAWADDPACSGVA